MNEQDGQPLGECPELPANLFYLQRIIQYFGWDNLFSRGETSQ